MKPEPHIVISLGGSLVVPDEIDTAFLKEFRTLILRHVRKGHKFIIIVGGGKVCRKYQHAASEITRLTSEDLDWLGIHSTRLNAHLLRTIFREHSYSAIINDPNQKIQTNKPVIIAAGWKPRRSTDFDAVVLARNFKSQVVLNLSNVDHVYTQDPKLHKSARPLKQMDWKDFRKLVGNKWSPGLNAPFDPVAAKEAERLGLRVVIMSGRISNIDRFLDGKIFEGTVIS